jgi:hypothetical protein
MAKTPRTLKTAAVITAAFATGARPATAEGDPRTVVLHVDDHAHLAPSELAPPRPKRPASTPRPACARPGRWNGRSPRPP